MIYFIQAGENGPIKIGQSNNVMERLSQLQTANPYELKLIWLYSGSDYTEIEIQNEFKHENIRGEWFHPSDKLFSFIHTEMGNMHYLELPNTKRYIEIYEEYPNKLSIEGYGYMLVSEGDKIEIMPEGNSGIRIYGNVMRHEKRIYKMPASGILCK